MIEALLSLPTPLGCLIFMALTSALGLSACFLMFYLVIGRQSDAAIKEIREATGNLLRVVGWLFCLLLSLTFTDIVREVIVVNTAVEGEAAAISDTHHNLRRFDLEETRGIQTLLADYTEAVIDDDWPALEHDSLSERSQVLLRKLEDAVIGLKTNNAVQDIVFSHVVDDMDRISDDRLTRLQQAQGKPPFTLIVVFFGYLVTMVCFGVYRPRRVLVGMVSLYTMFVGVVIYLILAMSNPFEGAISVDPAPLEYALEVMRANIG